MGKTHCEDCNDWIRPSKTFMVTDELWEEYGVGEKQLCVKCFENRLKRPLEKDDFLECFINRENGFKK
jgi:hypothetical protein